MMTMRHAFLSLFLISIIVGSSGCRWFGGKAKVSVPSTPAPVPKPPAPTPAPAPAPAPEEPKAAEPKPESAPTQQVPAPAPTVPATPATQPPIRPPVPKPKPAPASPVTPPAVPKPPAFGEILTPQQQAEANRAYDASAKSARESLARISGRALTRDQVDTVNRIRSFLKQAEEARAKDPATAAQLARRAEILANDLALSLR